MLNRNGSVNVGIVHPAVLEQTQVYTFDGNFTDGYRHFFQATFTIGRPTLVLVDAVKKYLDPSLRLHLADVEKFYFGGAAEESDEEAEPLEEDELFGLPIGTDLTPEFHRYRGCMSSKWQEEGMRSLIVSISCRLDFSARIQLNTVIRFHELLFQNSKYAACRKAKNPIVFFYRAEFTSFAKRRTFAKFHFFQRAFKFTKSLKNAGFLILKFLCFLAR